MEKLGKYCKIISGYAFKSNDLSEGTEIPVIKIGNISNGDDVITDSSTQYVSSDFLSIDEKYHIKKGDVLISLTGSHINQPNSMVGRSCRNFSDTEFLLNQRAGKVIPNENADKNYLYYLLNTESFKYSICNRAYGAANQANVSPSDIENIKWNFPALPTQQKIASILSAYDDLIQNYKKQIQALQTAASELYKEWFVRFRFPGYQNTKFENGIPEGWKIERIGNIGEVIGGGTPSTENEEYWDGDIPWLSPVDLSDNTNVYVSRGGKNITKLGLQKSSAKMMPKDTVLLSSRAPVGYVALAKNPICTNQGFKSVVCNTSVIQPIYLYFYFRMNKNYLQSIASGATFPELSGSMMKKLKVLLPQMELQKEFSKKANIFISKAELLSEQITNLTQQRDLLLPRLMRGALEVH